jgi:recombination protein RecT
LSNQLVTLDSPKAVEHYLGRLQPQMLRALPEHIKPARMMRLVMTAFGRNPKLYECEATSVAASVMTASQLGLEPDVMGQGFLVPYWNNKRQVTECQFIPGWKGLVDLANRSGRCTVYAHAVFDGDHFDYDLGSNAFVRHKPGDEDDPRKITHVYAIGKIKGMEHTPVIEVWTIAKVWKHRNKYNKQGDKHYSFREPEAYAKKIPLLQVLKLMPQSIELKAAMETADAADRGANVTIDAETWIATPTHPFDDGDDGGDGQQQGVGAQQAQHGQQAQQDRGQPVQQQKTAAAAATTAGDSGNGKPAISDEDLAKKKPTLVAAIATGAQVNDLIAALETRNSLTADQKIEVASWANPTTAATATEGDQK